MELVDEVLSRLQQTAPLPNDGALIAAVAVGVLLVLIAWRAVRMVATVCHEAGHALVAVVSGRRLRGVRVHADTSGLTLSQGRPSGPGMVFTLFAGYPAASVVGLVALVLTVAGRPMVAVWLGAIGGLVLLLRVRNLVGALVVLAIATLSGLLAWFSGGIWLSWSVLVAAVALLLAGPRTVVESFGRHGTDAAQLAGLTHVPRAIWYALWLAIGLGALALAVALLLPLVP